MTIDDFIKLGFKPNTDENGKKIWYNPEGVTYILNLCGNIRMETTDSYVGYLWHSFNYPFDNKLISKKCTPEKIEIAKKWRINDERIFLD